MEKITDALIGKWATIVFRACITILVSVVMYAGKEAAVKIKDTLEVIRTVKKESDDFKTTLISDRKDISINLIEFRREQSMKEAEIERQFTTKLQEHTLEINSVKQDVVAIKEKQKETSSDIKEILKNVRSK
jgi:hypothetical protein